MLLGINPFAQEVCLRAAPAQDIELLGTRKNASSPHYRQWPLATEEYPQGAKAGGTWVPSDIGE